MQKSCFVLLLYLLAACLILPLQTCSFQSQLRSREVITKVGCEKRSSLLGFSLEASRSESHIQVSPTSSLLGCTAPLGAHNLACVSVGAGANSNVKIVLCIIYLFVCAALTFLLVGSTLCHAVRLHKYLLWETVGGVAQCKEYEAGMKWRAKAV